MLTVNTISMINDLFNVLVIIVSNSTDNLFVNDGKYCLTFTEPQPIDRTDFNTGFISTPNTCQYVWVNKNDNATATTTTATTATTTATTTTATDYLTSQTLF
ncbi:hypothetical protein ACTFIT_011472 [Dictyostelium discoideum]